MNCAYCEAEVIEKTYIFISSKVNPKTGKPQEVPNSKYWECPNCSHTWMSQEQENKLTLELDQIESSLKNHSL